MPKECMKTSRFGLFFGSCCRLRMVLNCDRSLDYVATGLPKAGDVAEGVTLLDDASPWSFSGLRSRRGTPVMRGRSARRVLIRLVDFILVIDIEVDSHGPQVLTCSAAVVRHAPRVEAELDVVGTLAPLTRWAGCAVAIWLASVVRVHQRIELQSRQQVCLWRSNTGMHVMALGCTPRNGAVPEVR
jgi:hypothetical protein